MQPEWILIYSTISFGGGTERWAGSRAEKWCWWPWGELLTAQHCRAGLGVLGHDGRTAAADSETLPFFPLTAYQKRLTSGAAASVKDADNHATLLRLYSQWDSSAYHICHAQLSAPVGKPSA